MAPLQVFYVCLKLYVRYEVMYYVWTQQPQDRSLRRAYMKTECSVGFNNSRLYVNRLRTLPALWNYLHRLCSFSNRKVQLINPLTP